MKLLPLIALWALLAACGAPAAAVAPTVAPAAVTSAPAPAEPPSTTPRPTETPLPSATPLPTETLAPTATALPSPTPIPTAAPSEPARLQIAAIGLDRGLVSVGLDSQRVPIVPDHDVGWYNLSARPGAGENIVLWGHVLRFRATPDIPAPFARVKELALGAEIVLYDAAGAARRYVVTEQVWATPDQVAYILPQGREMLTLVSCIGDRVVVDNSLELTHRLITIAEPAGD